MKIGILGTGMVGATLGAKLTALGHEVKMGSRTADNAKALEWVKKAGSLATNGTFEDAARFGVVIFNCTNGGGSLPALELAGAANLNGKVLVDVSNPLDFSKGMPPSLLPAYSNTTSLAEEIQKAFPDVKVVKALNTMNCQLMTDASLVPGAHDIFMCGNDDAAKSEVKQILSSFGWHHPIDLGDLSGARGMEMILPIWVRLYGHFQSPMFNFKIVR